jgi:hypothetical protein
MRGQEIQLVYFHLLEEQLGRIQTASFKLPRLFVEAILAPAPSITT